MYTVYNKKPLAHTAYQRNGKSSYVYTSMLIKNKWIDNYLPFENSPLIAKTWILYTQEYLLCNLDWLKFKPNCSGEVFNKRPMGHIAYMRNQFKSMNTFEKGYDYIHYKIGPVVQEEKLKISRMYFCNFVIIPLCKKVRPFHLNIIKSYILFTQGRFLPSLIEIGPVVL